jgi:endoglucanase
MIMAYAYDFTGNRKYIDGVIKSMDYLMGRNPNIKCYVSGYGENPMLYPHHRFFCPQIDSTFPSTPPGFMSGGPNSGAQDPWASGMGLKTNKVPAQKCYVDHVESWSTNEVTINWNAPLAWLTGYLDEVGPLIDGDVVIPSDNPSNPPSKPKCYDVDGNGYVNIADIMAVTTAFNTSKGHAKFVKAYDFDDNDAVNIADIMAMLPYFNKAV